MFSPSQHPPGQPPLRETPQPQMVPVKVYATPERITIAAPMPGMEPEDILVEVTPVGTVALHGRLRGALKGDKVLLLNEWSVGPYFRVLPLPCPVDGLLANVTYGNGVLVVVLPISQVHRPNRLTLEAETPTRGMRANSAGRPVRPRSPASGAAI
ncbi:MAG: Hsp20/alpha crystallin family protein [Chloroflexi bacterium]|nr:Hsp20/alpha crystallin family protein [Chloroflexota bacterium]